ncbi:hypothetical protein NPIL_405962 [Nephila pilipes]|uniref:Uncharacterized protein n=1 Tax=Nephila pilipes TaxID=299642 RepID=A0A8X6P2B7_NEPPI|nr:hypothetical protein NPIL_405962 [Nephila pilipes]
MVQWSENRHGVHFLLLSFGISKDVEFVLSFRSISVIDMISSFFEFSAVDEAIVIFSVPEKNRGRLASLEFFALRKRLPRTLGRHLRRKVTHSRSVHTAPMK